MKTQYCETWWFLTHCSDSAAHLVAVALDGAILLRGITFGPMLRTITAYELRQLNAGTSRPQILPRKRTDHSIVWQQRVPYGGPG